MKNTFLTLGIFLILGITVGKVFDSEELYHRVVNAENELEHLKRVNGIPRNEEV